MPKGILEPVCYGDLNYEFIELLENLILVIQNIIKL